MSDPEPDVTEPSRRRKLLGLVVVVALAAGAIVVVASQREETQDQPRREGGPAGAGRTPGPAGAEPSRQVETSRQVDGRLAIAGVMVRPVEVPEGERPSMTFVNTGRVEVSYGLSYRLELRTPWGWHWVNRNQAFRLPLLFLEPGERTEPEEIAIYFDGPEPVPLAPGLYRITKSFDTDAHDDSSPTLHVAVRFTVVRESDEGPVATLEAHRGFEPYPGDRWYGPRGDPVPLESQLINVISGPDHCEWESATMLHVAWPPDAPPGGKHDKNLQYIRDPDNAIGYKRLFSRLELDTKLPPGARYTGYRTDFMELWVRTYEQGSPVVRTAGPPKDIYLVFEDRVERWPLARDSIACA